MLIAFVAVSALVALGFAAVSFDRAFILGGETVWNAGFIAASLIFLALLVRLVVAVARDHIERSFHRQHGAEGARHAHEDSHTGFGPRTAAVSGDSPVRHHAHAAHGDPHLRQARTGHAHEEAPR